MFITALKTQIMNAFLALFGYLLALLVGILVGAIIVYVPGITGLFAQFTTIHPAALFGLAFVIIKMIKG